MPERTTEVTLGEVMRAVERLEKEQTTLRTDLTGRLDNLAQRATPLDRFADRNTIVQEKIEDLLRALEQERAQRIVEVAAEEAARVASVAAEETARRADVKALNDRMDKEKADRMSNLKWIAGFLIPAVVTSIVGLFGNVTVGT